MNNNENGRRARAGTKFGSGQPVMELKYCNAVASTIPQAAHSPRSYFPSIGRESVSLIAAA